MRKNKAIIYGAYGYTGKLIAYEFRKRKIDIVLSGKNEEKLKALSAETGYDYAVVNIDNHQKLVEIFSDAILVINAAGPFINTCIQLIEACLQSKTHYIDINGDIKVFELIKTFETKAVEAEIMLLPGTGFDIVPTDCLANKLKKIMPDATQLKIAFATIGGGVSHGTAATVASRLGEKAFKRENGKLIPIPLGKNSMEIDFGLKKMFVMSIPWGDISTAWTSTGIPNIECFMAVKPKVYKFLKLQFAINWLLKTNLVKSYIRKIIDKKITGPDENKRFNSYSLVWAEVKNDKDETKVARLKTHDGYTLTAIATVTIAEKIFSGNYKKGYQTPASAYDYNLIEEIEGIEPL
ncbi:MAG: saccharopine dehydrogenase NADP-binding domain-containing protein [Bacteroidetes bacterium]|nr:saccharopine dehydrogenase NADP-binding domain-containing protein [Bacteroidota bacterium]